MNEKRFKVGDLVTYKPLSRGKGGDGYYYAGKEHGGYVGKIIEYQEYVHEQDCWEIRVTCNDEGHEMWGYRMLESEFEEYDQHLDARVVSSPKVGDKVIRGRDWEWNTQDEGSVYGVVKELKETNGWCSVEWMDNNGNVLYYASYRCGHDGKYDLYYYNGPDVQQSKSEMELIQEEAKRRFPIGCQYIPVTGGSGELLTLLDDKCTYRIVNDFSSKIWAHSGGGCLYDDGKWAERVYTSASLGTGTVTSNTVIFPEEWKWKTSEYVIHGGTSFGSSVQPKPITHQRPVITKTVRKASKLVIK